MTTTSFPVTTTRLIVPLIAAVFAGCSGRHETEASGANLPPIRVQTAVAHFQDVPTYAEVAGTVRPVRHALVAAKIMGTIEEMPVVLGQRVGAGDRIAKIAAGEIAERVRQAQAQLNQARRDLERERDLLARNASTSETVKNLEDRLVLTQAVVREAEVALGHATVSAPFDGVVARKIANAGDLAAPGSPLIEIEGTSEFTVEAGIPDSLARGLAVGAPIAVAIPTSRTGFTGTVAEISSAADSATRTVLVKILVPAGVPASSGQYSIVQVPADRVRALSIPAGAVSVFGQMERVFVVEGGRAVLRLVKTGAAQGGRVEVLSGLSEGDRVVVGPPAGLREGRRLEVAP